MSKLSQALPPLAPLWVRSLLLLALPLFALLLYLDGQRYDPGLLDLKPETKGDAALFPNRLAGLDRNGQVRVYDRDNLYEYINGHADWFIGAGFEGLSVGEYGSDRDGAPRLVINLYAMGNALNAFGVLVNEAGERPPIEVGDLGFRSGKGVSFIQGPYYVQVSPFDPGIDSVVAAREVATGLTRGTPGEAMAFRFPDFGTPGVTRYTREYYRGMDFLNNVLERPFERNGGSFDAFLLAGSTAEVESVTAALTEFLRQDGIPYTHAERNGLDFYEVQDPYEGEWFFVPLPRMLVGAYTPLDDALAQAVVGFAAGNSGGASTKPLLGTGQD